MKLIFYIIVFLLLDVGISIVMQKIFKQRNQMRKYIEIISYIVSFLLVFGLIIRQAEYKELLMKNWRLREHIIFYFILAISISILIYTFRMMILSKNQEIEKVYFHIGWIPEFILKIIIAPVCEEILCRNLLLVDLLENYSFILAAFIVSLVFAILHLQFDTFLYFFASSLIFSYIFYVSGSVIYTICSHIVYNFLCSTITVQIRENYVSKQ